MSTLQSTMKSPISIVCTSAVARDGPPQTSTLLLHATVKQAHVVRVNGYACDHVIVGGQYDPLL
jgi:hypothetical protein